MPTIEQRLSQWQQELLDLSNRNRLLNFRPSTARPLSIQLFMPSVVELYEALAQGKSFLIAGNEQPDAAGEVEARSTSVNMTEGDVRSLMTSVEAKVPPAVAESTASSPIIKPGTALSTMPLERTNRVALRLLTRARSSEQEQGINILFAVFGLLKWQEQPRQEISREQPWRYAPLVMLPLKIEEIAREGTFRISAAGEDPEFNQTLAERLKRDFGQTLSVDMDEETRLNDVLDEVGSVVVKQPGWEILEQAHIGLFQFHKLRMFTDLAEHVAVAAQHEIVRALASETETIAPLPEGIPTDEELDRVVAPQHSFTVLDADASQLSAIQAAIRPGTHLVIQGPPGTGKSQTIANIIAEFIAAGRTVLFVSEKAAAIEVVHRRLTDCGLGDFCLMLHSQKANKRDVIYELGARLEPDPPRASSAQEELNLIRLQEAQVQLNAYAEALHREHVPLRESAFWAHGELAALHDVPYLDTSPPSVDDLTHKQLDKWNTMINQVARYASVLNEGASHPWSAIRLEDLTLADQQSLRSTLTSLRTVLGEIRVESQLLAEQLKLPAPITLEEVRNLVEIAGDIPAEGGLRPEWFDPARIKETESLANEAATHAATMHDLRDRLFATYHDGILDAASPEAIASYERGRLGRLFSLTHRRFRAQVHSAAKDGKRRAVDEELASLRDARQVNQHLAWFREREATLAETLGLTTGGATEAETTVWARKAHDVGATAAILARLPSGPPAPAFVEEVCRLGTGGRVAGLHQRLDRAISQADQGIESLRAFFEPVALQVGDSPLAVAKLDLFGEWLDQRLSRFDDLNPWLRARAARAQTQGEGLGQIIEQLMLQAVPPERWSDAFRRLILTHWLDRVYREDEVLHTFSGDEFNAVIARFRDLDRHYISTSVQRLRRELAARQVRINAAHGGEPGLLQFETRKRRRHLPLRRLFERIPNLLPTIMPCLMMSPLSVAQFLPADRYQFDVVIFDEASQVRPHDAIGAIMRGKQLVVAGDNKQLPPTTFFDRTVDDPEHEEAQDIRALESILDGLTSKQMPSRQLLWHYRSRHEDLIAFSNHHFYERRLITFPSSMAERSTRRGVHLEYVPNARYEDDRDRVLGTSVRVNRTEAKRVAQLVLHHARTRPDESLGVVALGMNQRDVVDEEIKHAQLLDQSLDDFFRPDKPDPFFVKALEQVQGDERDVIMISIGYGKNPQGVLSHNFGPINQDGGERRLNVLVTRARHQVIVVSSIRAGDIDLSRTQKLGPRLLKNYLDFAERGPIALEAETIGGDGEYESPFEVEVGEALKRVGFDVHRQVGCSKFRIDLAIVDPRQPGRYLLGIECDGMTYHQSKTARDRDRLRQEILESLGWKIHRIWSTDWIRQPERALDRVIARVNQLLDSQESDADASAIEWPSMDQTVSLTPVPGDMRDPLAAEVLHEQKLVEVVEVSQNPETIVTPYLAAEPNVTGYGDILSTSLAHIADVVASCVEVEGPVHCDLVARRIVAAWGYQRAGSRIAARIEAAVSAAVRQGRVTQKGPFLWPPENINVLPRGPMPDGTIREISHIADEEIVRGMTLLLEHAFSLTKNELVVQTARLFGYQRTGSDIRRRMRKVVQLAVKAGSIQEQAERYQLPRSQVRGQSVM